VQSVIPISAALIIIAEVMHLIDLVTAKRRRVRAAYRSLSTAVNVAGGLQ